MTNDIPTSKFIHRAKEIHQSKYDYSFSRYEKSCLPLIIKCPAHGNFSQSPNSHLKGRGCPLCGKDRAKNKNSSNLKTFISKANTIHKNKYNYSQSVYTNSKTKIKITCPIHGEFYQTPVKHLVGAGCRKCGRNICRDKSVKSKRQFIKEASKIHKSKYDYSKFDYISAHTKGKILCPKHGEFWQTPNDHLFNHGCPFCIHRISIPELKFLDYLKISKQNRQKRIGDYTVDGYDSMSNTIYEFLGDYWHGNPNKYKSIDINQCVHQTFGKLYDDTIKKFKHLKLAGYNVKYIWESDWKKFQRKIHTFPSILNYVC